VSFKHCCRLLVWTFILAIVVAADSQTSATPRDSTQGHPSGWLAQARSPQGAQADWARVMSMTHSRQHLPDAGAPRVAGSGTLRDARHLLVIPTPKATREYQYTFRMLLAAPQKCDRYDTLIVKYARRHGLDPRVVKSIIAAESEFNRSARSPAGARGLMQLLPSTARSFGVAAPALEDPEANIRAGTAYLARLYALVWERYRLAGIAYEDAPIWVVQRVIAAYHAGPKALPRNRWRPSTQRYLRKVLLFYQSHVSDLRPGPALDA